MATTSCEDATHTFRERAAHPADPADPAAAAPPSWRAQFAHPVGLAGHLAGHLMALKNGARSRWVLGLLALRPVSHVLEIGFGPGVDLRRVAAIASAGRVVGVDPSEVMLAQARARNQKAIAAGRVELHRGDACALPVGDGELDVVFSINAVQFWRDLRVGLCEARRVLRPGGRVAIAIQPRNRDASAADTDRWQARLVDAMAEVGFEAIVPHRLASGAVPTTCVGARRPGSSVWDDDAQRGAPARPPTMPF